MAAADDGDFTMSEIVRALKDVRDDLRTIVERFDAYVLVKVYEANQKVYEANQQASDRRIAQLEDNQKWLARTIGGMVIAAVLSAVGFLGAGR